MFYFWLILIITLSVVEMITPNLVCIWFIISGLISLLTTQFIDSFITQFAIFVLGGVTLLLLTKKTNQKLSTTKENTNFDRIIGMTGIITKEVTKNSPGEVKVDGKYWTAISNDKLLKDTIVKITKLDSTKLTVEKEEK